MRSARRRRWENGFFWSIRSTARANLSPATSEYTVNVALIADGRPIAGIIAAPAIGVLWRGVVGQGAERMKLRPGAAVAECDRADADPHPPTTADRFGGHDQPLASRRRHRAPISTAWPACSDRSADRR